MSNQWKLIIHTASILLILFWRLNDLLTFSEWLNAFILIEIAYIIACKKETIVKIYNNSDESRPVKN